MTRVSEEPLPKRIVLRQGVTAQLIGYTGFSRRASAIYEDRGLPQVSPKTISNYYDYDRKADREAAGRPRLSRRLPQPVATDDRGIPLWLPSQVVEWVDNRPGEGNRTRGEARRKRGVA